jgi:hypothetical protein
VTNRQKLFAQEDSAYPFGRRVNIRSTWAIALAVCPHALGPGALGAGCHRRHRKHLQRPSGHFLDRLYSDHLVVKCHDCW